MSCVISPCAACCGWPAVGRLLRCILQYDSGINARCARIGVSESLAHAIVTSVHVPPRPVHCDKPDPVMLQFTCQTLHLHPKNAFLGGPSICVLTLGGQPLEMLDCSMHPARPRRTRRDGHVLGFALISPAETSFHFRDQIMLRKPAAGFSLSWSTCENLALASAQLLPFLRFAELATCAAPGC
jgi:hypothetical protein